MSDAFLESSVDPSASKDTEIFVEWEKIVAQTE